MGAKRILALGSVAALCAGAAAPLFMASAASADPLSGNDAYSICVDSTSTVVLGVDFSDLEFHFTGNDGALVLGHWHLTRDKDKGDIGGVFSLVWQRFPEGWRIIHDHTSAVAPTK